MIKGEKKMFEKGEQIYTPDGIKGIFHEYDEKNDECIIEMDYQYLVAFDAVDVYLRNYGIPYAGKIISEEEKRRKNG